MTFSKLLPSIFATAYALPQAGNFEAIDGDAGISCKGDGSMTATLTMADDFSIANLQVAGCADGSATSSMNGRELTITVPPFACDNTGRDPTDLATYSFDADIQFDVGYDVGNGQVLLIQTASLQPSCQFQSTFMAVLQFDNIETGTDGVNVDQVSEFRFDFTVYSSAAYDTTMDAVNGEAGTVLYTALGVEDGIDFDYTEFDYAPIHCFVEQKSTDEQITDMNLYNLYNQETNMCKNKIPTTIKWDEATKEWRISYLLFTFDNPIQDGVYEFKCNVAICPAGAANSLCNDVRTGCGAN